MRRATLTILAAALVLSGCASVEERQKNAANFFGDLSKTAPGTVQEIKGQTDEALKTGKSMMEGVTEMINDAKRRIGQVQSGMNMMMDGKELIESGVSGE